MCGIVGYVGKRPVLPVLLEGLRRLEYRGYDSAGVVFFDKGSLRVLKRKGRVYDLEEDIYRRSNLEPKAPGLGHTRWATHGEPNEINAHPHFDCKATLAIVHNGIIENFYELKKELIIKGHKFISDTDTEVIAHLIEEYVKEGLNLFQAFLNALKRLKGAFAVAMISTEEPEKIYVARFQSPVVVGLGEGENFLASDIPALLPFTKKVVFLEDGEVAILSQEEVRYFDFHGRELKKTPQIITWDLASAEKGGYSHFMLKEIYEQPSALQQTLLGRLDLEKGKIDFSREGLTQEFFSGIKRIFLVACGTSYHACLVGKYLLERVIDIPIEVDLASEFRYRNPRLDNGSLFIALSQSGETADTLASLRLAKEKGARTLAICNVLGSTITRESDIVLYTQAGPEISVASTKAFTTQVLMFILLSLYLQEIYHGKEPKELIKMLPRLPGLLNKVIEKLHPKIKECAKNWYGASNFLYLGRNILYPIALEGALKLKEISYIHAEGYAAGEMKHGPIALIDENFPTVILSAKELGIVHEKTLSNAEEIRARRGPIILFTTEGESKFEDKVNYIFYIPETCYAFLPILYVVPLQLLAFEIAYLKGCDIDKPRNLAKSVTVE